MYGHSFPDSSENSTKRKTTLLGTEYDAGSLYRFLFGSDWCDLWTTPINIDTLKLDLYNGGLVLIEEANENLPEVLSLKNEEGREYRFRPIHYDVNRILPEEIQKTFSPVILNNLISVSNPVAPLIVYPIVKAAGIKQPQPLLCVLPEYGLTDSTQKYFKGSAGFLECYPDADSGGKSGFTGWVKTINTDSLLMLLEDNNYNRINAEEYLKVRLLDIFFNNWDRQIELWGWTLSEEENYNTWSPAPKHYDIAFARYNGFFPLLTNFLVKKLVSFDEDYYDIESLTYPARYTDRRLLVSLSRPEWDSVTNYLENRITDSIIISAVKEMPPEMFEKEGEQLIEDLILRRDKINEASEEFYNIIFEYADIYGSNLDEYAEITRLDDKQTIVNIFSSDDKSGRERKQLYSRIFNSNETNEIRLLLLKGDDSVFVKGNVNPCIKIIVSDGDGNNLLADISEVQSSLLSLINPNKTDFYVADDTTKVIKSAWTNVYPFNTEQSAKDMHLHNTNLKNYGFEWNWLPWIEVNTDEGLLLGAGRNVIKYGYARDPFFYKLEFWIGYAFKPKRVRSEFTAKIYPRSGTPVYNLSFNVTGIPVLNYYGKGNETFPDNSKDRSEYYDIDQQQFILTPYVQFPLNGLSNISVGTTLKYVQTERKENTFLSAESPYGIEDIVLHSIYVSLSADTRNGIVAPTSGYYFDLRTTLYPGYLKNNTVFGKLTFSGRYYYEFDYPFNSSLAMRAGGEKIWGTYPFFEASFIGGQGSIRGVEKNRFAGDASVYSGIELRSMPWDFNLFVPVKSGFNIFIETGRVFSTDIFSGLWHHSYGGGLLLTLFKSDYTFNLSAARSRDDTEYYFITGFAF